MSEQPMTPEPQIECGHECLKDNSHVERGEPHFYGYSFPSKSDLRAQLAQLQDRVDNALSRIHCDSLGNWFADFHDLGAIYAILSNDYEEKTKGSGE